MSWAPQGSGYGAPASGWGLQGQGSYAGGAPGGYGGGGGGHPYGTQSLGGPQHHNPPMGGGLPYGTQSMGPQGPPPTFKGWHTQFYYQLSPAELAELQRWFTTVDRDRSGTITADELQGLAFGGRPLGYDSALKIVKVFDRDYSGSIDFYEYASLHKFLTSMQNAFIQADVDRNGVLDTREIGYALQVAGFSLTPRAVQALYRRHDRNRNQGVSFPMFLDIAADIALLKNQFEWMDTDRDGLVTVNLDQLITMVGDI